MKVTKNLSTFINDIKKSKIKLDSNLESFTISFDELSNSESICYSFECLKSFYEDNKNIPKKFKTLLKKIHLKLDEIEIDKYRIFNFHIELKKIYSNYNGVMLELSEEIIEEWKNYKDFNYFDWILEDENLSKVVSNLLIVHVDTYETYMKKLIKIFSSLSDKPILLLSVPKNENDTALNLGAKYESEKKIFFIDEKDDFEKFERWFPLTIELVPNTAWYENLRYILPKELWDKVRKNTYRKHRYRCEICGGRGEDHPVECHELWEYNKIKYSQSLIRLLALCPKCHMAKHIGLAGVKGIRGRTIVHISRVNNWTIHATKLYTEFCFRRWEERNMFKWNLNLENFENEYDVKIHEFIKK